MLFVKRQLETTKWKKTEMNFRTNGGVPSQICPFPRVKTMFCVPVNPFNVNVVSDSCPVHQPFVTHLTAAVIKLADMQKNLALKKT